MLDSYHLSLKWTINMYFYPHEESHEGLGAKVLQFQTYAKVLKI